MANDHPFQLLFETLGREPVAHAEVVNRRAFEALADLLAVPQGKPGRCILLRAPRAGHGKTHLLSRVRHELGASSEFIPVHAVAGSRIDAASVTGDTLRRLVRPLPASGGLTVLDLVTRRLFASALQPLVGSGEVPCQDREGALNALRVRPIETFDFHHPTAVTAHWARENFEVLGQRLSAELAHRAVLPASDVAFWVDALFRYASAPLESVGRAGALTDSVHAATGAEMERLAALLGLLTLLTRVVLVADDLEGFSADESAALRLAAFLGALRQAAERVDVILSLNRDVWESAFLPRLSGGLADRLSEVVVELEPLTEPEMAALLDSRAPGLGATIFGRIDIGPAVSHARGLIRAAGMAWEKAAAETTTAPAEEAPDRVEPEEISPAAEVPAEEPPPAEEIPAPATADAELEADDAEPAVSWPSPEFPPPEDEEYPFVSSPAGAPDDAPPPSFVPPAWQEAFPASTPFATEPWQPDDFSRDPGGPPSDADWPHSPPFSIPEPPARATGYEPPADSPFRAFHEDEPPPPARAADPVFAVEDGPEPILTHSAPPGEISPPPAAPDTDRVDDLLRQFRERYGRGSL